MRYWTRTDDRGVARFEFDRPPRNFMSFRALAELRDSLEQVATDPDVAVVVLASAVPGYFVAHADLDDLLRLSVGAAPEGDPLVWFATLRLIETMPQPVVAVIDGQAWGGGLELALACTVRLISRRGHLAFPEVALGIVPGSGGTVRLPRLIGAARAAELVLSGRVVAADEAAAIGLARLLPDDDFVAAGGEWAADLAGRPRAAVAAAKALLAPAAEDQKQGLRRETGFFVELQHTDEAVRRQRTAQQRYRQTPPETTVYL